jgi:hypothetical protein
MTLKAQFQAEYQVFSDAEVKHLDEQSEAYCNLVEFKWYRHGPPKTHKFQRKQLDQQIPNEEASIDQGLGKVVADQIAVANRAFNLRYGVCRLDLFAKQCVRADQTALSLESIRDRVSKELTS